MFVFETQGKKSGRNWWQTPTTATKTQTTVAKAELKTQEQRCHARSTVTIAEINHQSYGVSEKKQ
jgi:hypothetical protein